jgi:hypothetical protein
MPEWAKMLISGAMMLATAFIALREGAGPKPVEPKRRRRARPPRAAADAEEPAPEPVPSPFSPSSAAATRSAVEPEAPPYLNAPREWLLDALPVEPAGAPRDRAAGAGRLAIGITGMAIAGALVILGISRAFSAVLDRLLR